MCISEYQNLVQQSEHRKTFAFSDGTKANQRIHKQSYLNFCSKFDIKPLFPSEENISAYIEYLAQRLTSYKSLANYISGVRTFLKYNRADTSNTDTYHVNLLLMACKVSLARPSRKKEPISIHDFRKLCQQCNKMGAKGKLLKVAITFCFFGMVRQSNVAPRVSKDYNYSKHTSRGCVSRQDPGLVISLPWTKTRQAGGKPLQVPLPQLSDKVICPVQAYNDLCNMQSTTSANQPLLCAKNGKSLSYRLLNKWFKQALTMANLPTATISLHSLRRSSATIMAHSGVNLAQVKCHGDWKSSAFWHYISAQKPCQSVVAKTMKSITKVF